MTRHLRPVDESDEGPRPDGQRPVRVNPHLPTVLRERNKLHAQTGTLRAVPPAPARQDPAPLTVPMPVFAVRRALWTFRSFAQPCERGWVRDMHGEVYRHTEMLGSHALRALLWASWVSDREGHPAELRLSARRLARHLHAGDARQVSGQRIAYAEQGLAELARVPFALRVSAEGHRDIGDERNLVTFLVRDPSGDPERYRFAEWYRQMMIDGLPARGSGAKASGQFLFRLWWPAVRAIHAQAGRALLLYLNLESHQWRGALHPHPAYPGDARVYARRSFALRDPLLKVLGLGGLAPKKVNEHLKHAGLLIWTLDARYGAIYAMDGELVVFRRPGGVDRTLMIPPDAVPAQYLRRMRIADGELQAPAVSPVDEQLAGELTDSLSDVIALGALAPRAHQLTVRALDAARAIDLEVVLGCVSAAAAAAPPVAARALRRCEKRLLAAGVQAALPPVR